MVCYLLNICLIFIVHGLVDGSDNITLCDAPLCHEYLKTVAAQQCSREKKFIAGLNTVNWFQALEDCEMQGYKLASILSEEENDNLVKYIEEIGEKDKLFWLSGNDLAKEGEFVWASSPATKFCAFTKWYPEGEPNNKNDYEDCVQLEPEGYWNDRACYSNLRYVCEYFLPL